jgi:hypothetical protein
MLCRFLMKRLLQKRSAGSGILLIGLIRRSLYSFDLCHPNSQGFCNDLRVVESRTRDQCKVFFFFTSEDGLDFDASRSWKFVFGSVSEVFFK